MRYAASTYCWTAGVPGMDNHLSRSVPSPREARLLLWCALLYLSSFAIDGLLRHVLSALGIASFLYLRDALIAGALVWIALKLAVHGGNLLVAVPVALYCLTCHFLLGLYQGASLFSALFALKIYLPLVFGLSVAEAVAANPTFFKRTILLIWIVSLAGVILNDYLGSFPWEGSTFDTAFGSVNTVQHWWTEEGSRLPGFARASYSAAMALGLSGSILVALVRGVAWRATISIASAYAIYLTTTKGMLIAFSIVLAWQWLCRPAHRGGDAGIVVVMLLAFATVSAPPLIVAFDLVASPAQGIFTSMYSLWDRFANMWPQSFALIENPVQAVVGKGLGAIGTAQIYGDLRTAPLYGDNFFVYQYVVFGAFSLLYIGVLLRDIARTRFHCPSHLLSAVIGIFLIVFAYGFTGNMVEEPFLAVIAGIAWGLLRHTHRSLATGSWPHAGAGKDDR